MAYSTASQRWHEVGWRPFELPMVRAALDQGRRARGSAGHWPSGLESEAALERREKELDAALGHR